MMFGSNDDMDGFPDCVECGGPLPDLFNDTCEECRKKYSCSMCGTDFDATGETPLPNGEYACPDCASSLSFSVDGCDEPECVECGAPLPNLFSNICDDCKKHAFCGICGTTFDGSDETPLPNGEYACPDCASSYAVTL